MKDEVRRAPNRSHYARMAKTVHKLRGNRCVIVIFFFVILLDAYIFRGSFARTYRTYEG